MTVKQYRVRSNLVAVLVPLFFEFKLIRALSLSPCSLTVK